MATVKELKVRAAELKIVGRSTMTKAELEDTIADAEGRNVPPLAEYGTAVQLGDRRSYEEKATEALESVLSVTMDTLAGNTPFPVHRVSGAPPEARKRRVKHRAEKRRLRIRKRGH